MAPIGIVALVMAPVIGRNLHRINLRLAPTICVLHPRRHRCSGSRRRPSRPHSASWRLPRFIMGFGLSLFFLPLNQIIMAGISPAEIASAAGLSNFVRTFSGSISTAVCVFMWNDRSEHHYATPDRAHHAGLSGLGRATRRSWRRQGITGDAALRQHGARGCNTQALTLGANDIFLMMAVLFVLLIPVVWLARPPFRAVGTGGAH